LKNLTKDLSVENRGALLVITLARAPKANALTLAMTRDPARLLCEAQSDTAVRGALITGAGERAFCAGVDVREASDMPENEFRRARSQAFFALLLALCDFEKPLVAAVNGAASGGGFMIAALADAVVATEGAIFSLPEIDLGSPPLAGLVILEPWLGAMGAYELVQSGRRIGADEAERRGLVRVVLPRAAVFAQAEGIARELLAKNARALRRVRRGCVSRCTPSWSARKRRWWLGARWVGRECDAVQSDSNHKTHRVIPAKPGIPFPRARGKVGWGPFCHCRCVMGSRLRGNDSVGFFTLVVLRNF